ncbi:hypothetical protein GQ53DRAFT_685738 [Thozetella sp. PMI_491]|nr:hypothetical protein GQ53DRAFT_685738 [Thozetella sp. PMI_491]
MLRNSIEVLTAMMYGLDSDGVELFFSSRPRKPYTHLKEPGQFVEKLLAHPPVTTPFTPSLGGSIIPALKEIFHRIDTGEYKRKMTLLVFTDGVWPGILQEGLVFNIISTQLMEWYGQPLTREMLDTRNLSIQFIGFGDDPVGIKRLQELDDDLKYRNGIELPDIIDYEPATGDVYKMIIGSLNEELDNNATGTELDHPPETTEPTSEAPAETWSPPDYNQQAS